MVGDYKKFLNIIKNLELYLIEFKKDKSIKTKNYLNNYIVKEDIYCFIIVITHNKYTFFTNNKKRG